MTVTTPQGFRAAGIACGLRKSGAKDLALIVNEGPQYTAAAVTTANRFTAAPVVYTREVVANGQARAVVLNAANANACTGPAGYADTVATAKKVGETLDVAANDVVVCSTGLIGKPLAVETILAGIETAAKELASSQEAGQNAAQAIMTTDTYAKNAAVQGAGYSLGGIVKGAGMLAPEMATMLCVITTDAVVAPELARTALQEAVGKTYNRLDSDGCMSTNDTVVLLASGASAHTPSATDFTANLTAVCADLAAQLIDDAEGASHVIRVEVAEAATEAGALAVARAISRSNLVKTAIFGNDANWGRVLAAAGTVPADIAPYDPAEVELYINGVCLARQGSGTGNSTDLSPRETHIRLVLNAGSATATLLTNDLTHDYVHENSAYST
ncbi:bifunctional glutamate N-acetyltransferase/amino-acid acetyltransferase ArgJ [Actinobaculum suis]|uniref:bifunctional glutamate N-acetyltransferase/amino-acid acetyltransferase ArgJ n=1 Tax=Actinobaculum suis TaxID=1657 RepID=UPI0008086920|nr:bifunctional glutamate N-acetyltransferase/amino-acid acetyltransferase ArgJ [Actinobaculum suis]OCA94497.1 bifunctional ornithine acetyltransferase/N-acetylglutamate synthase [Actinobaculum suis]OCA94965.1 bifunctional ornithine acetyltransferase/N-acetylglutamate synthase [Actinobaculum suis]